MQCCGEVEEIIAEASDEFEEEQQQQRQQRGGRNGTTKITPQFEGLVFVEATGIEDNM